MPPFNVQLSQFFGLCLFLGGILWAVAITLMEKFGLTGPLATPLVIILSVAPVAWFVFGRRHRKKSLIAHPMHNRKHRIGYVLVTLGNTSFGLATVLILALSQVAEPVVGGIVVFVGIGLSLIFWLVGWHLTEYFKIF